MSKYIRKCACQARLNEAGACVQGCRPELRAPGRRARALQAKITERVRLASSPWSTRVQP